MCCTNDKKPVFKGIQVPPAASAAVGASSASAVAIATMAAVLLLGLASPAAAFGVEKATGDGLSSYCVFLDGSQELDCVCPDNGAGGDGDFSSLFSAQGMISSYVTSSKSSSPSRKKSSNVAAVHLVMHKILNKNYRSCTYEQFLPSTPAGTSASLTPT